MTSQPRSHDEAVLIEQKNPGPVVFSNYEVACTNCGLVLVLPDFSDPAATFACCDCVRTIGLSDELQAELRSQWPQQAATAAVEPPAPIFAPSPDFKTQWGFYFWVYGSLLAMLIGLGYWSQT